MSAYVVVQLAPRRGKPLARDDEGPLSRSKAKRLLAEHDARLLETPRSTPAEGDGPLITTIAVPDMERANKLAAALRDMDGIETAYAKPPEELP